MSPESLRPPRRQRRLRLGDVIGPEGERAFRQETARQLATRTAIAAASRPQIAPEDYLRIIREEHAEEDSTRE